MAGHETRSHKIVRVEAWKCVIKLPAPFALGHLTVSQRDYVVVRVITDSGLEGVSFGLGRGAPVDIVITELLAPHMVGRDLSEMDDLAASLAKGLPQHAHEGLVMRGLSQLDIALWDLKGSIAGRPVWQLLGATGPQEAKVMLVEGYHLKDEDDESFARRLGRRAAEGYSALKVEASTTDHEALSKRLVATRHEVGPDTEIVIDLAYGWPRGATEHPRVGWWDLDLAWAEDPMHGNEFDELKALHEVMPVPLGSGDEVTDPDRLLRLIEARAVDVVRLDITCHGGLSGFHKLHKAALDAGIRVSTHVYPELHRHVVHGFADAGPIEMFPNNGLWDATHTIIRPIEVQQNSKGEMIVKANHAPGLGLDVDWGAVSRYAVRHTSVGEQ